jgi:hypothetical protein
MKSLGNVEPTPEQLVLISNPIAGVQVIRGAAGSGKTTTALLMLRQLSRFWISRRKRHDIPGKVNILVLTYNRTLRGYIQALAENQVRHQAKLNLTVSTFGKWARDLLPSAIILDDRERERKLMRLSRNISLPSNFIMGEIEYLLGRFQPNHLADYLTCRRVGRGNSPRVERSLRQRILDEIIFPYMQWKEEVDKLDWNDFATKLLDQVVQTPYDIIIADETQDLSANQIRSIMHFAAEPSSVVFVLDATQMIYPRGFT